MEFKALKLFREACVGSPLMACYETDHAFRQIGAEGDDSCPHLTPPAGYTEQQGERNINLIEWLNIQED